MLFNMEHKASGISVLNSVEIGSMFAHSRSQKSLVLLNNLFYLTIPAHTKDYFS